MSEEEEKDPAPAAPEISDAESQDYQTLAQGFLSPRHRRLAQLAAEGRSNADIGKELDYSGSRVSILLKNPYIMQEVRRLQDRIFEATIAQRLKGLADPALNNIEWILTDKSGRVRVTEKADMSKWVVEKLDGKAIQKTDIGENLLTVLMDRLDGRTTARQVEPAIEITATPSLPAPVYAAQDEETPDELLAWVESFE